MLSRLASRVPAVAARTGAPALIGSRAAHAYSIGNPDLGPNVPLPLPFVPKEPTPEQVIAAVDDHAKRNMISTDSSLINGYIQQIKEAGVYPTLGLGLFALISKEMFILDGAELLLSFNMALLGTGVYVFASDIAKEALMKERINYYKGFLDTFKLQRDLAKAQLEVCEASKSVPAITEEIYHAFKEANEAAATARDLKARAAYRASTVAKLQAIQKAEQEALATQRAAVQNEALTIVMDALKESKVRAAVLEEAISYIGVKEDKTGDNFKAVTQVVEDTLKSVRAKVAAAAAKKA